MIWESSWFCCLQTFLGVSHMYIYTVSFLIPSQLSGGPETEMTVTIALWII